ncbi:uncharacterized protein DUF3883 [Kineococcus rhizosphaerae]|uniref:Uncharacterized protein DUF3883 n=2 Tax=Kineococcus rhizosphaerae TaxID=559628 RepID=A0A2T0QQ09_9ACTN|nr:uncharacterized protein DUF3883 [Kineococcus rhizosphaerae]
MQVGRRLVTDYEANQGRTLQSMESGWYNGLPHIADLERRASAVAGEHPGRLSADFASYRADGSLDRVIEMKTKQSQHTSFDLYERQIRTAQLLPGTWWLYVPFDCATARPQLVIVSDLRPLITEGRRVPSDDLSARRGSVGAEDRWRFFVSDMLKVGTVVPHDDPSTPTVR